MMKSASTLIAILFFAASISFPAFADDKLTQDQVRDLAIKANGIVETLGVDAAREIFNKEGEFKFGETYATVIDFNGVYAIFPPRPEAVGKSVLNVRDADGKFLVQEMIRIARENGEGWTEYRWLNPVTNKIQPKATFIKRVAGTELLTFIGIYK